MAALRRDTSSPRATPLPLRCAALTMHCSLPDDIAWRPLLRARELFANGARAVLFVRDGGEWRCEAAGASIGACDEALVATLPGAHHVMPALPPATRVSVYTPLPDGRPDFTHRDGRAIDEPMLATARVYLPVLLGAAAARAAGRAFVVGHVTQTLDGRIACLNGQSQWIGNDADRRHCHRMRALLDGVLVGAATVLADDPLLTVRHVTGPNPRRIVLSGSGRVLQHGSGAKLFGGDGCDVVVAAGHDAAAVHAPSRLVVIPARGATLPPPAILSALQSSGVHSLFVEGGAGTISSFLAAGAIDLMQVHIAPKILGSGLPSVFLPIVEHVRDGLTMVMDHAGLDGDLLLSCWPRRDAPRAQV